MKKLLLVLFLTPGILMAYGPGYDGVQTGDSFSCKHHVYHVDDYGNSTFLRTEDFGTVNSPSLCYELIDAEHAGYNTIQTLSHDCQVNSNMQGPYN